MPYNRIPHFTENEIILFRVVQIPRRRYVHEPQEDTCSFFSPSGKKFSSVFSEGLQLDLTSESGKLFSASANRESIPYTLTIN